ncbi:hypothetical protein MCOR21_006945 [Pyricularia oryzae]|nr:hypothetical protein MCOR21_006945 [Pyricularia oryzae]KAI6547291.1 hypothetical protein MCOR05_000113 [Pyricularia oryzae]
MHISKASQLMALLVIGAPVLAFTPKGDNPLVAHSPDPGAQADVASSPKVSSSAQESWKLVNGRVVMKHPAARPDLGTEDKPNRLVTRRTRYDSDNDDDDDDGPIPGSPPHNRKPKDGVARGGPSQKKPNRLVARRTRYDSDNDDDDDDGPIPGSPPHNRKPKGGVARGRASQRNANRLVARGDDDDDDDVVPPSSPKFTRRPGDKPRYLKGHATGNHANHGSPKGQHQ